MSTTTIGRTLTGHEPSWWLRSRLDALPERWQAEGVHVCPHVRRNAGVGITALHRPDTLTCPDRKCSEVFRLTGPADHECDRCHEHADTLAGAVYDTTLDRMRLLVMFGLCPACEAKELSR